MTSIVTIMGTTTQIRIVTGAQAFQRHSPMVEAEQRSRGDAGSWRNTRLPGSTDVTLAVSSNDSHVAICLPSGHHANPETTAAVAIHIKLAQYLPVQFPTG